MSHLRTENDIRTVAVNFAMPGEFLRSVPCGAGHINDTYEVHFSQGGVPMRYILQRINHQPPFPRHPVRPPALSTAFTGKAIS